MTLEKAVKMLKNKYEWAKTNPWIRDPLAWALYQTWTVADREQQKEVE